MDREKEKERKIKMWERDWRGGGEGRESMIVIYDFFRLCEFVLVAAAVTFPVFPPLCIFSFALLKLTFRKLRNASIFYEKSRLIFNIGLSECV